MRLLLVRHGQAMDKSDDPTRPLTPRGREEVARVAAHAVSGLGLGPARILHSGKTRARETAEILGAVLGGPVEETDGLAPNDDPAIWIGRVGDQVDGEAPDLMLVGHLPHLERLAGLLVAGEPSQSVVGLTTAELVVLERDESGWSLVDGAAPDTV